MNKYWDYLTVDFLRKNYVSGKMTAREIHNYFLARHVDIHVNIITYYGNKVDVYDRSQIRWR